MQPEPFLGRLVAIFTGAARRKELHSVEQVEAIAGHGLQGDRFFRRGTAGKPDQELTLIASEALAAVRQEFGIMLEFHHSRRNLLTEGVPLNDLVGKEFLVGDVRLRGVELCEPCKHLEMLTVAGIKAALRGRGGLRAAIVQGGVLHTGDRICPCPSGSAS